MNGCVNTIKWNTRNNQIQMSTLIHQMSHTLHIVIFLSICILWVRCKDEKSKEDYSPGNLIKHAFQNNSILQKFTNESSKPLFDPFHLEGYLPDIPDLNPLQNSGAKGLREKLKKLEPILYRVVQETTVFIGTYIPEIFVQIFERITKYLPEMVDKKPLHKWNLTDYSKLFKEIVFNAPFADKIFLKISNFATHEAVKHPDLIPSLSSINLPKIHL